MTVSSLRRIGGAGGKVCWVFALVVLGTDALGSDTLSSDANTPAPRIVHRIVARRGWTIHVDERLLTDEHAKTGRRALDLLTGKLLRISVALPTKRLRKLQDVPIFLDLDHPLRIMQYHASAQWLRDHRHDVAMAKSIQIPNASRFVRLLESDKQPWVVMHELAHAYHDRVLGFDEERIKAVYEVAKADSRLQNTVRSTGERMRHYALVDHKEFFAEMTETYLGSNDFYPFNRRQLNEFDRRTFELVRDVWSN